jgi:hypothetical protein
MPQGQGPSLPYKIIQNREQLPNKAVSAALLRLVGRAFCSDRLFMDTFGFRKKYRKAKKKHMKIKKNKQNYI